MDIFSLLSMCKSEEGKGKTNIIGIFFWVLIGLAVMNGALVKLSGDAHDIPGFWHWLWHGETVIDADFSNEGGRARLVDMDGGWRFATGDDANRALPEFDDSSWSGIKVSASWEDQGYEDYDGYAWYRREFNVDAEDLLQPFYVYLGKIDDGDEVFINGYSIGGLGGFPPQNTTAAWNVDRFYRVPSDLVRAGTNVIAIRVYDSGNDGGVTGENLGLYTTNLPQPLIDLSGKWEFATGNDPRWQADSIADKTLFHPIQVPSYWDYVGYKSYDGHAWYRTTFGQLPVAENETLILFLGKIDDTDEVFLNGTRIGDSDRFDMNRRYEFSSNLLQETNTLAVHVYDGEQGGGIYAGPVGIMKKTDYVEYQKQAKELKKWRVGEKAGWRVSETIDWLLGRDRDSSK
jgi:hypothetical protein